MSDDNEKRPVGRPRKIEDVEELDRHYDLAQLKLAVRIMTFTEDRLNALEKGIGSGAVTKMDLESFKVAVSANVEAQKSRSKAKAERPAEPAREDFDLDKFLKEQS